ncbi:hypothetical protein Tco_0866606 [Tanacetum coccineum]
MTHRSCIRWKPTGKIFKTVGLRWVPTGKIFTSSITKVDSEPTNGSNDNITNKYECEQTLDVSAGKIANNIVLSTEDQSQQGVSNEDSYKDGDGDASFQLKSDSLPHAHAQTTKTYYKHQDSRIKKAQELKDKVFRKL